jgi:hypothetical protein
MIVAWVHQRPRMRTAAHIICSLLALAGSTARAQPEKLQCWDCVQRLAMELPEINAQEDPFYEEGLTPASVLPALSQCSLDDGEIPVLQQIIKIFTDAWVDGGGAAYVREHLDQIPQVSADDRAKLTDGARQSLDSTLRHLIDHNCRILLKSHFDEGASRDWLLQVIQLGRELDAHSPSAQ